MPRLARSAGGSPQVRASPTLVRGRRHVGGRRVLWPIAGPALAVWTAVLLAAPGGASSPVLPLLLYRAPFSGTLASTNTTYYLIPCSHWTDPVAPGFNFSSGLGRWQLQASGHSCGSTGNSEVGASNSVTVEFAGWTANATRTVRVVERVFVDWTMTLATTWGNPSALVSAQAAWGFSAGVTCTLPARCVGGGFGGTGSNTSTLYRTTGTVVDQVHRWFTVSFTMNETNANHYTAWVGFFLTFDCEAWGHAGNRSSADFNIGSGLHRFGVGSIRVS